MAEIGRNADSILAQTIARTISEIYATCSTPHRSSKAQTLKRAPSDARRMCRRVVRAHDCAIEPRPIVAI